ncbi:carbohydrate kinase [Halovivax asiaticus JCM 14624]|uniref:Bifunctional NAD(P)H-hydrate repair enzyme n=1 Tax=Halovivax asiaticus JCM 14624 TaxID=1227490 RepID=M0BBW6_9EURY|nr:bifunctional ADP-dependent NAD(P)H-hydrate dehydratase/NAD(P)H-hydrate epimerase [Halovivax asiaticus]ELZ08406.1 carbohydrate kinase [Halovivax asiaticus JCM 14624]
MLTGRRMAAVDENAAALGVSQAQLMESSGNAVARLVREVAPPDSTVVVVAGRGNNGGDGFVTARFLDGGEPMGESNIEHVETHLLGRADRIGTDVARRNWDALVAADADVREVRDSTAFSLPPADVVVDAMLGTGISGAMREPAATAAEAMAASNATVVSVDVPSGFDATDPDANANPVGADYVVTFHDIKPGLPELDADCRVADIGIPAAAERLVGPGDVGLAQPTSRTGRAYVVGGGPYTGAPALAAQAALRAGMELSFVAAPTGVADEIQGYAADLIVQPYDGDRLTPDHVDELVETAERYDDVVVLGPGLGSADESLAAARQFLEAYTGPAIVDAEALSIVPDLETEATLVCTPNARELERMGGPAFDEPRSGRDEMAAITDEIEAFAADLGHVVLVKGADDVVSDGERTRIARVGVPGMAVGGTGDLLAGITAGLLEHADPFEAACAAAYVNGRAGEVLADRWGGSGGLGITASDLLTEIPGVLWGESDD